MTSDTTNALRALDEWAVKWAAPLPADARAEFIRLTAALATAQPEAKSEGVDGWIAWGGGKCPVDGDTPVDVRLRLDGIVLDHPASYWDWAHDDSCDPILAYRPARQAQGGGEGGR